MLSKIEKNNSIVYITKIPKL